MAARRRLGARAFRVATLDEVAALGGHGAAGRGVLPPMMGGAGFSLVGSVGAVSVGTTGAAVTPSWGTGSSQTAGNLLLCWVCGTAATGTTPNPATPSGWSLANGDSANSSAAYLYYRISTGGDVAPTIGIRAGVTWQVQLAEFSGNRTLGNPTDGSGSTDGTTSPLVVTNNKPDVAIGQLLVYVSTVRYTNNVTQTLANALNNATAISTNNNGTATNAHYDFGYGVTTTAASGISDSFSFPTGSLIDASVAIVSFKLPAQVQSSAFLPRSQGPAAVGPTFFPGVPKQQYGIPAQPGTFTSPVYLPRSLGPKAVGPPFFAALQPAPAASSVDGSVTTPGVQGFASAPAGAVTSDANITAAEIQGFASGPPGTAEGDASQTAGATQGFASAPASAATGTASPTVPAVQGFAAAPPETATGAANATASVAQGFAQSDPATITANAGQTATAAQGFAQVALRADANIAATPAQGLAQTPGAIITGHAIVGVPAGGFTNPTERIGLTLPAGRTGIVTPGEAKSGITSPGQRTARTSPEPVGV